MKKKFKDDIEIKSYDELFHFFKKLKILTFFFKIKKRIY